MSTVTERYPIATEDEQTEAIDAAVAALQAGELVVVPTDTVYGVAADAFDKGAVAGLLAAKGRGRSMPPPVLISNVATLDALATRIPDWARALVEELWPGALTVVFHQQPSLQWDLGEARQTVAVRIPDSEILRKIIDRVGPLATSSANRTTKPAATNADQADEMLGRMVKAIIDGGESPGGEASTIIAATGDDPEVLREGAISVERIDEILAEHDVAIRRPGEPEAVETSQPPVEPTETTPDADAEA
ncbi:MAG: L-threonylcarbamoyladenylate synthase [Nocardioides sp.]|uniref:L-threonylcarbamoyladenylate synthase n=1 Tax=Nocardioides sp. TaxID=35761 RepID=UPI003D6AE7AB